MVVMSELEMEEAGDPAEEAGVVGGEPGLYGGGGDAEVAGEELTDSVETGDTTAELEDTAEVLFGVPMLEAGDDGAAEEDGEAGSVGGATELTSLEEIGPAVVEDAG
jgi:hypothetical protein